MQYDAKRLTPALRMQRIRTFFESEHYANVPLDRISSEFFALLRHMLRHFVTLAFTSERNQPCQILPRPPEFTYMGTMNISLPDPLREFIDEQVKRRGYGTSSEYVRDLIRRDQERIRLRGLLLDGAASRPLSAADGAYFEGLRKVVRRPGKR